MSQYIALTFGPITRVISLAKTTRGMWAASYLFSYLAKQIIAPFMNRNFLLPYIKPKLFEEKYDGAGIFPDRYIFESSQEEDDFGALRSKVESVIGTFATAIAPQDADTCKTMLMQYLKVYFYQTDRKEGESDRDVVKRCEEQLALFEQYDSFIPAVPQDQHYLSRFINSETLEPMRFLLNDAGIGKFQSVVEITTGHDGGYNVEPHEAYERYIAIVYADGDSMGKAFSEAADSNTLSRQLLQFNKDAVTAIKNFSGQPVYIGGDDLFFFAPVYNPVEKQSIFTLLETLDKAFHTALGDNCPATLSFGVSITYYKYPMQEAVKLSQYLLDKAKGKVGSAQVNLPLKNNVLFAMQKHSGQTRSALLHKGCTETVKKMNDLIDKYVAGGDDDDLLIVSSVMHNLREHEAVLLNAISDNKHLGNYFTNNYNEPSHEQFKGFFKDVQEFLKVAYSEYLGKTESLKNSIESPMNGRPTGYDAEFAALDLCHATLQFIHLVNMKKR